MTKDDILGVKSPKNSVRGPYAIVYKGEYSAIVAMDWDNCPVLGMRWFDDGKRVSVCTRPPYMVCSSGRVKQKHFGGVAAENCA